ncbi:MAG: peptide MFS transporter, partial [Xanthobacteraceae bacterium]|nr:peptide MFS transporter [Xanthobacteraceae bacterium]
ERFSYYGMRALLTLYMVKYLLLPDRINQVWGEPALRSALETLFGPLGVQPFASQIYGLYTSLVYFTPILGGLIADRVLGQRRTVIIGAALMAIGHFMMASERLFLLALIMLVLGNGAFKPNISTQVGALYSPGDPRRDRAFSIFYVGINVGAFFAPLVSGTLAVAFGWHYGFAAAGIGMLIGLAIYLKARSVLPPDEFERQQAQPRHPLTQDERRGLFGLAILFVPVTLFWATYEQQGNTIALWAEDYTVRSFDLGFWRGEVPAELFQSINPFLIFAFTPFIVALWSRQAQRGSEPSTVNKMAFGCLGIAFANLLMVAAAAGSAAKGNAAVSATWLLGYFVIVTLGELYLSPTGLSLVTKVAPARYLSMTMGVWLATSFLGNFIAGWLGSFWSGMEKRDFFLMIAAIAAAAAAVIFACNRPLRSALKD